MSKPPSTPWVWTGGYPQRITGPDATLIAEVFEDPDSRAEIAPLICDAVNAYLEHPSRWQRFHKWMKEKTS